MHVSSRRVGCDSHIELVEAIFNRFSYAKDDDITSFFVTRHLTWRRCFIQGGSDIHMKSSDYGGLPQLPRPPLLDGAQASHRHYLGGGIR